MSILLIMNLFIAAALGTAVILIRDTVKQILTLGLFSFSLALLFILYQAPDVAMAHGAVSGVIIPILILLAVAKMRKIEN